MNWLQFCEDTGCFEEIAPGDSVNFGNVGSGDGRQSEYRFDVSPVGQYFPVSDGVLDR